MPSWVQAWISSTWDKLCCGGLRKCLCSSPRHSMMPFEILLEFDCDEDLSCLVLRLKGVTALKFIDK